MSLHVCGVCIRCLFPRLDQYTEEQKLSLVDCCPTKVFEFDEYTQSVMVKNPSSCIFCKECVYTIEDFRRQPEDKLAVEVKHSADKFSFTVETTGALLPKEVIVLCIACTVYAIQHTLTVQSA
jgi:hypothetical protein